MKNDSMIKDLFEKELTSTQNEAPSFEASWNAAKRQRAVKRSGYVGLLAAAAILLFAVLYNPAPPDIYTDVEYETFAEWQAPSDVWFAEAVTESYDVEFSIDLNLPSDELEMIE